MTKLVIKKKIEIENNMIKKLNSIDPSDILSNPVLKRKYNFEIQSVHIDTSRFPRIEDANRWIVDNGFEYKQYIPDPNNTVHSYRQLSRDRFDETTLTQFKISDGINVTLGTLKEDDAANGRGYTRDVEHLTFDMIQDKITRGDVLLSEVEQQKLLTLQDEYLAKLSSLKTKLNTLATEVDNLMLDDNELVERYKTTYDIVASELNDIDEIEQKDDYEYKNIYEGFEHIENDLVDLYTAFDGSSLQKMADLFGSFILTLDKLLKRKKEQYNKKPCKKENNIVEEISQKSKNKDWSHHIPIHIKKQSEEEERIIFGIVLEPNDGEKRGIPLDPDAHGDIYSQEDVKKAAYSFMEDDDAGNRGYMHQFFMNDDFTLLENFVTKGKTEVDTENGPIKLRKGTWVISVRVNSDAVWTMIKNKEITGFSIGGTAEVEEIE